LCVIALIKNSGWRKWSNEEIYIEKYARMNSSKAWMHEKRNTKLVDGLSECMEGCTETVNDWNDIPLMWAGRIAVRQSWNVWMYRIQQGLKEELESNSPCLHKLFCITTTTNMWELLLTLRLGNQGGSSQLHCPHQRSSSVLFDTAIRQQSVTRLWRRPSIKRLYFTCGKVAQFHICLNAAMNTALLPSKVRDTGQTNVSQSLPQTAWRRTGDSKSIYTTVNRKARTCLESWRPEMNGMIAGQGFNMMSPDLC
jgi:hypothetical protein